MSELFADTASEALKDLVSKQDAWLMGVCRNLNVTPQRLAELYELEAYPIETGMSPDGNTLQLTQTVRLKRREPPLSGTDT